MSTLLLCLLLTLTTAAADASQKPAEPVDSQIATILAALPGETAFAFSEIQDGKPKLLYGVRADKRMAVGSSFKLYIFGTLVDEVNLGRRRADNIMLLRPDLVGPPASEMGTWPMGSPVTLHTLTLKMISISDNTATDHLLYLLGRQRIERQMATMGHGDLAINRPLLSTREMTMLRDKKRGLPGANTRSSTMRRVGSFWPNSLPARRTTRRSILTRRPTTWRNGMPRQSTWLTLWPGSRPIRARVNRPTSCRRS